MGLKLSNGGIRFGRKQRPSGCLVLIMGVIFIAVSVFFFRVIVAETERDSSAVENDFVATLAEFDAIEVGGDVVVTGEFADNGPVSGDAIAIQKDSLLHIDRNDSGDDWRWKSEEREQPVLTLQIEGGMVRTAAGGNFDWRGDGLELIDASTGSDSSDTYSYGGQELTEGATRTYTLHNGDRVTLLGSKTESGAIRIRHLYNGEREGLGDELSTSNFLVKLVGYVFGGAGVLALLGGVLSIMRGRL